MAWVVVSTLIVNKLLHLFWSWLFVNRIKAPNRLYVVYCSLLWLQLRLILIIAINSGFSCGFSGRHGTEAVFGFHSGPIASHHIGPLTMFMFCHIFGYRFVFGSVTIISIIPNNIISFPVWQRSIAYRLLGVCRNVWPKLLFSFYQHLQHSF